MNNLSLYLHIPFCKGKCHYCDFYSLAANHWIASYEKALEKSIFSFSEKAKDFEVQTIYFGGGTPSLLTKEGIQGIFSALRQGYRISPTAEITVEMNPESATEEVLLAFYQEGANRLSFGVQSAREEELALLGRRHRFEDAKRAVERARSAGFDNISLDLMYGLPGQSAEDFQESLEKVLSLSPKHLSFYLLTLSSGVPLYQKRKEIPDDEILEEMYFSASRTLSENGYLHYEISNAALPGFESRHNKVYWEGGDYLGFGPGAHSLFQNQRFSVLEDVEGFMKNPLKCYSAFESRLPEDLFEEYVMLSLRQRKGLSFDRLNEVATSKQVEKIKEKMTLWTKHGLCEKTKDGFALTTKGFFVSNEIISELI